MSIREEVADSFRWFYGSLKGLVAGDRALPRGYQFSANPPHRCVSCGRRVPDFNGQCHDCASKAARKAELRWDMFKIGKTTLKGGFAIASLVLAIISVPFCFFFFIPIIGILLGLAGLRSEKHTMAVFAITLNCLALLIFAANLLIIIVAG